MDLLLNHFWELTITGLAIGAVYSLVALGYTLVYGVLRLINFAHSEVFMWGSFAAVWVLMAVGAGKASGLGLAGYLLLGTLAAMAVSALVALVLEFVAYRPLRKRNSPPLIALISAIGASFTLSELMGLRDKPLKWFHADGLQDYLGRPRENLPFPLQVETKRLFYVFNYHVSNIDLIVLGSAIVMMVVLDQFIKRSRLGRGIRAVAQDPEAAALMGVNRDRVIRLTFLIGGLMAGAAAMMYLLKIGVTRYNAGFILGVKAFTAAVLGGIGNLRGALLGGFILGVAENYGSAVFGSNWKDVVAFVLLVVILLFRPTGLLGESLGEGPRMSTVSTVFHRVGGWFRALPRWAKLVLLVLAVLLVYLLPVLNPPLITTTDSDFGAVLFSCAMYALVAIGLNIVIGYAGLLDLGYIGFFAVGAFTVGVLGSQHAKLPLLLCIPAAMAVTMVSGVMLGAPTLRVRGDYLAIVTLGFGEIIRLVLVNTNWLGASRGISNIPSPPSLDLFGVPHLVWNGPVASVDMGNQTRFLVFSVTDSIPFYWLTLSIVLLVLFLDWLMQNSRVGRAWEATREDEDAAELMGVPTFRFKLLAFATGAAIGGLSGALFATKQAFINPDNFTIIYSVLFVAMVVVGGQGNRWGVVLAAALLTWAPEKFRFLSDARFLLFGIALMALAIFRPQGLLPPRRTLRAKRADELAPDTIDAEGVTRV